MTYNVFGGTLNLTLSILIIIKLILLIRYESTIVTWWSGAGGIKPYLQDQLVSFSALTLLVWSYDL